MITDKKFIDWFTYASERSRMAMFNFAIYTMCSLPLKDRILAAGEIILGKKFCLYISKDAEKELNLPIPEIHTTERKGNVNNLKFRAWHELNACYIYWEVGNIDLSFWHEVRTLNLVVDRWTGLQDKNNVDVYENDLIKSTMHNFDNETVIVSFIEGGFCCAPLTSDLFWPIDINHFYPSTGCCLEVVDQYHE